ncbi:MAG TPA: polysaccharide deacetylase family protein [Gallionellaceae bacterium]|nr:polysaccharide deacetylase family protein [Gallionellaceae bacterium]
MARNTVIRILHSFCIPVAIAFCCCAGAAAGPAPEPPNLQQNLSSQHSHEEETAKIRKHHLKRLEDRLTIEPSILQESCRYESDISTRPPLKRVALTFDDGPEPGQTEFILEILKKHGITAAFFMIGQKAQQHPELVEKVRAANHQVIGNHSWDHPNFHEISTSAQAEQVLRNELLLANDLKPKLFRYPYGNSSCETNKLVHSLGYKIVGWHIDSCDWAFEKTGSVDIKEAISCGVLPQYHNDYVGHVVSAARARNGGIILMHEIHPNTIMKLEEIITQLQAEGFAFGTILDEDFQQSMR